MRSTSTVLGRPSVTLSTSPHHQKADEFEVVEARYIVFQKARGAGGKEARQVFFRLFIDNGLDSAPQQLRRRPHIAAVLGRLVVCAAERRIRLVLAATQTAHGVEGILGIEVAVNHLSLVAYVDKVEGVNLVACLGVELLADVAQDEDDAGLVALDHRVNARRHPVDIRILLVVGNQVHPEIVETKVGNGYTARDILEINGLVLHLLELLAAVFKIALFVLVDVVIVASGRHDHRVHTVLDTRFEVDVMVKILVWPEVNELDDIVLGTDAVNTAKTLNDAHGVPVNVVIHQVIRVLKVLALRDAVRGDEDVDILARQARIDFVTLLGDRREAREDLR